MRSKKQVDGDALAAIYASSAPHAAPDGASAALVPVTRPLLVPAPTVALVVRVDAPSEHERATAEISGLASVAGTRAKHYLVAAQQAEDEADRAERLGALQRAGSTPARGALRNRFHGQAAIASRRKRDKLVAQARAIIQADAVSVHVR